MCTSTRIILSESYASNTSFRYCPCKGRFTQKAGVERRVGV